LFKLFNQNIIFFISDLINEIKFIKSSKTAILPTKKSYTVVTYELYAAQSTIINKGESDVLSTDMRINLPVGLTARITPSKRLAQLNGANINSFMLDLMFCETIMVCIFNFADYNLIINKGECIAEVVIEKTNE
jgi:dUTPase